jgi:dihydroorotate dehydrogenase electron transfer subunit
MPLDVAAEVLSNTRLSSDYNVLELAAPDIATNAAPGQFVMLKTGERLEPLLRRPFSVFEILKKDGRVTGLSVLNKRIGPSTRLLFDARPVIA